MEKLKSCPFCGGEAKKYYREKNQVDIICLNCQCRTGEGELYEVIKAWNTRTK